MDGDQSTVYIRVQTNSLPNHCFGPLDLNPIATETDWTVEFNKDVKGEVNHPYGDV